MGLVEAILEGSSLVKEAKDKAAEQGRAEGLAEGLAEGRAKGRAEGRAEGARRVLRICLRSRFPTLEAMPEIDAISRIEAIEALLQRVLMSASQDEIQREILAIARESR